MSSHTESHAEQQKLNQSSVGASQAGPLNGGPRRILGLQRTAGNAAVSRMLAAASAGDPALTVQRLSLRTSDLDKKMGASIKGLGGKFGSSSYAKIRALLGQYEQAERKGKPRLVLLQELDEQCTEWLNAHRKNLDKQDQARRAMIEQLQMEAAVERNKMSQKRGQDIYMESLTGGALGNVSEEFRKQHLFQAATSQAIAGAKAAREGVATGFAKELHSAQTFFSWETDPNSDSYKQKAEELKLAQDKAAIVKNKGLTAAEIAAIFAYTAQDYKYINPAAENSSSWMEAQRSEIEGVASLELKHKGLDLADLGHDDASWGALDPKAKNAAVAGALDFSGKTLMEEGSLHAAVARAGLLKLDKVGGTVYRAQSLTPEEFQQIRDASATGYTFRYLVSTSKSATLSINNYMGRKEGRPIPVLWVITNHGGRDITPLSANPVEGEVMLPPGTVVKIQSILPVPQPGRDVHAWGKQRGGPYASLIKEIQDRFKSGSLWTGGAQPYVIVADGPG